MPQGQSNCFKGDTRKMRIESPFDHLLVNQQLRFKGDTRKMRIERSGGLMGKGIMGFVSKAILVK